MQKPLKDNPKLITRKSDIKKTLEQCIQAYYQSGLTDCVNHTHTLILTQKVKFPLLEYCADELYKVLPKNIQISFCDQIQFLKTEGGNVILGKILQKRLTSNFNESFTKATEYIANTDIWYVCDIIGERVFGYALLTQPKETIPKIKELSNHSKNWVIRSLGAGIHYAIKKGLDKENVKIIFKLLLDMTHTKDKEIKQGIGWAAKTTAKFHPEIIEYFQNDIQNKDAIADWFRNKILIGLSRNSYAK